MIKRCLESLVALDGPIGRSSLRRRQRRNPAARYSDSRRQCTGARATPGRRETGRIRRCFERSTGEIIYLTDADCIVSVRDIRGRDRTDLHGDVVAATGTSRPWHEQLSDPIVFYQWSICARSTARVRESNGCSDGTAPFVVMHLSPPERLPRRVPIGTDYHLARQLQRNGEPIRYVPAAVESDYPTSPRAVIRQQSRWLRNIFLHGRRTGRSRGNARVRAHRRHRHRIPPLATQLAMDTTHRNRNWLVLRGTHCTALAPCARVDCGNRHSTCLVATGTPPVADADRYRRMGKPTLRCGFSRKAAAMVMSPKGADLFKSRGQHIPVSGAMSPNLNAASGNTG